MIARFHQDFQADLSLPRYGGGGKCGSGATGQEQQQTRLCASGWYGADSPARGADSRSIARESAKTPVRRLSTGKVRRHARGQHKSESLNVREQGRSGPKAWGCPMLERVCPKVQVNPQHTRARLPPATREAGSVEGTLGTPIALAWGAVSNL